MQIQPLAAKATRYTGTGAFCLTSANAAVVAIVCANSATAGSFQLFAGVTATGTGRALSGIVTFATISQGIQPMHIPAYGSGGLCINIGAAANPDLTIYWSPV